MENTQKTGVLLLNLGGPEKTEDVRPFLYNLFSDRQIIRLGPPFLQKPLAHLIAKRRAPKSIANYEKIGGGSPIGKISRLQASLLEQHLQQQGNYLVRVCMRYWHPFALEVLEEMKVEGVNQLVLLPLYPHYSVATTGSSFTDLYRTLKKQDMDVPVKEIKSWPTAPEYIACLAQRVEDKIKTFNGEPVKLLYSAHSLPIKFIEEGDPYVEDLHKTIAALEKLTGLQGTLCYQSRSGPVEWLGPSTPDTITKSAAKGHTNILIIPLSFVSDHVETLYEIDMEYRELAEGLGINFACTEGLNDHPLFISALQQLVLGQ